MPKDVKCIFTLGWKSQLFDERGEGRSGWSKEWYRQTEQNDNNGKDFTVSKLRILKNIIW